MNANKNTILIIVVIISLLGLLFWLGRANVDNSGNSANLAGAVNSNLVSSETNYDFGTISMAAGNVRREFTVKNNGTEPLKIERMYTSCMCTTADFRQNGEKSGPFGMPGHGPVPSLRKVLAPGEEAVVAVVFDPAAHGPAGVGPIERQIYFEGDDGLLLALTIRANVTP